MAVARSVAGLRGGVWSRLFEQGAPFLRLATPFTSLYAPRAKMSSKSLLVVASLALSVLLGLVLGRGEGRGTTPASAERKLKIGLSLDTLEESRWARDRDAFKARVEELGAEAVVLSANGDDTRQMADVESLITSKVDVMVIVPHDGAAMAKAVRHAHAAGIPVISYDRLILNSDVDLYITFDNRRVGQLQGEFLVKELSKKSEPTRIVRIFGAKTDHNALLFKEGQDVALAPAIKSGLLQVIHEDWADEWTPENAKRITNAALTKHGQAIDGVLASNDGTAGGAIQALREEGLAKKVVVTGQDAELVACQRIVTGEQAMTIYKPVRALARKAADVAFAMAKGRPIVAKHETHNGQVLVPSIFEEVVTVTRDNLDQTVVADGFHKREDVHKGPADGG